MAKEMTPVVASLVDALAHERRRGRQEAAHVLAEMAREDPTQVLPATPAIVDALEYPEAQTRWECLEALRILVATDAEAAEEGFSGAEETLFDEGSPAARMAAFRYLARLGASSVARSARVWPLLSEALMCYHGDPEYREMLGCMLDFARSDLDATVRDELVERMAFDAKNGRGRVKALAREVADVAKGGA